MFKSITEHKGYYINEEGKIRDDRGIFIGGYENFDGRKMVVLNNKRISVASLVAKYHKGFQVSNSTILIHLDGNYQNCHKDNLDLQQKRGKKKMEDYSSRESSSWLNGDMEIYC